MGGGGEHQGARDAESFVTKATALASRLLNVDRAAQLIFVKGPFFSKTVSVPRIFRVVDQEPHMPALFAIADAAVIRPGFNSVWECISGRTPILPVLGTSYQEPMIARVERLREFGLTCKSLEELWRGRNPPRMTRRLRTFQSRLPRLRRDLIKAFSKWGVPSSHARVGKAVDHRLAKETAQSAIKSVNSRALLDLRSIGSRKILLLRIDDITEIDEGTLAILSIARRYQLRLSLEVVPYLCRVSDRDLSAIGLTVHDAEVGQHGYSHIQREWMSGSKSEFSLDPFSVPSSEIDQIAIGKQTMEQRFGKYFRRGFSPPYDGTPHWLSDTWKQLGGQFLSVIRARPHGARIPFVFCQVDAWNWTHDCLVELELVLDRIRLSTVRNGYAGLVLHNRHFRDCRNRDWLDHLFESLVSAGFRSSLPSEVAILQAQQVLQSPFRKYETVNDL